MAASWPDRGRRAGVSALGVVLAAVLCVSCTSSKTSSKTPSGSTTTSGSSSSGGASSVPFCASFNASALAGLGNVSTQKDLAKLWNTYAAQAPSEIKPQAQDIAKYVNDLVNGDLTAAAQMAQKITQDSAAIGAYYAAHCHA